MIKKLGVILLAWGLFSGAQSWADTETLQSLETAAPQVIYEQLKTVAEVIQGPSGEHFAPNSLKYVQLAMDQIFTHREIALLSISEFIRLNDQVVRDEDMAAFDGIPAEALVSYALETQPQVVVQLNKTLLESMSEALNNIAGEVRKVDLPAAQSLTRRWNQSAMDRAEMAAKHAYQRLSNYLEHAPAQANADFWMRRGQLLNLQTHLIEAIARLLGTSENWGEEINQAVERFIINADGGDRAFSRPNLTEDIHALNTLLNEDTSVEVFRAWVNEETGTKLVGSVFGVAQVLCIYYTLGVCGAALPATLTAAEAATVTTAATVATFTGTIAAAQAAIRIIDRGRLGGGEQLVSLPTLFDVLLILCVLPGPPAGALAGKFSTKILGVEIGLQRLSFWYAGAKSRSLITFAGVSAGYGTYQLTAAEKISAELAKQGTYISPNEIRMQGAINLAIGVIGGFQMYRMHQANLAASAEYQAHLAKLVAKGEGGYFSGIANRLNPWKSLKDIGTGVANTRSALAGNGKGFVENLTLAGEPLLGGLFKAGYQYAAWGTAAMLAHTYSDVAFREKSPALPEVGDGEIALILNGFSETDVLYYGFTTEFANAPEIQKYKAAGKLYYGFFKSPQELFQQIHRFGTLYGKIKYLKIMSHGVPGRLVPDAARITGEGEEIIDLELLTKHRDDIRGVALSAMAENAQLVFISCLVGGNLKDDVEYKGMHFEKDAGDRFMEALGDSLLVRGGSIDSSRRIIVALDGALGSAGRNALVHGYTQELDTIAHFELNRWRNFYEDDLVPLASGLNYIDKKTQVQNPGTQGALDAAVNDPVTGLDIAQGISTRFLTLIPKVWEIAYKFGHQLEGDYVKLGSGGYGILGDKFTERHRHDEFPNQNLTWDDVPSLTPVGGR